MSVIVAGESVLLQGPEGGTPTSHHSSAGRLSGGFGSQTRSTKAQRADALHQKGKSTKAIERKKEKMEDHCKY